MIRAHFDGASRGNPGEAGAGMVIYDANQTAYVTPDESLVERLRKHKEDK